MTIDAAANNFQVANDTSDDEVRLRKDKFSRLLAQKNKPRSIEEDSITTSIFIRDEIIELLEEEDQIDGIHEKAIYKIIIDQENLNIKQGIKASYIDQQFADSIANNKLAELNLSNEVHNREKRTTYNDPLLMYRSQIMSMRSQNVINILSNLQALKPERSEIIDGNLYIVYTVRHGDTLRKIAGRLYNDEDSYMQIVNSNQNVNINSRVYNIDDPDVISSGQKILLPIASLLDNTIESFE